MWVLPIATECEFLYLFCIGLAMRVFLCVGKDGLGREAVFWSNVFFSLELSLSPSFPLPLFSLPPSLSLALSPPPSLSPWLWIREEVVFISQPWPDKGPVLIQGLKEHVRQTWLIYRELIMDSAGN